MKTLSIKVLILALLWTIGILELLNVTANAEDVTLWIEKISYAGHLWNDTIVDIIWTKLSECHSLYVDSEQIFISEKSDTKISFPYSSVSSAQGYWELHCDSKNIKFFYKFPYITSATPQNIENFKRRIHIQWENFNKSTTVTINGWSFEIVAQTGRLIIWSISKETTQTSVFVEQNWLKSNTVQVEIAIPQIHSIQAPDWFYPGKKILITWKNITHSSNTTLFSNENNYKYTLSSKKETIEAILGKTPWTYTYSIEYNGIISNSIEITVIWEQPVIKRWYKSNYIPDEDSWKQIPAFSLDMVDVKWEKEWIQVWHNWKSYDVDFTQSDRLFVDEINLTTGKNYFYVESHGSFSEVYILENANDNYFPSITSIEVDGFSKDGSKRVIRVAINYYDSKRDSLYLNWSKLSNFNCLWNLCTILVSKNTLNWRFDVEREGVFSLGAKTFDIRNRTIPYFEWVKILWTDRSSKIEIFWSNLIEWDFDDWDLFSHNNKDNPSYTLNQQSITWKLQRDLTYTGSYSVWFNQYWESTNHSFKLEDFNESSTLYFPAKLIHIWTNNEIFAWEATKIYGFWFTNEDSISIWSNLLSFDTVTGQSNRVWSITIPDYFPLGTFDLKVNNISWKDSESISINILPPRNDVAVEIINEPIISKIPFYKDEIISSTALQKITIWKLYSDVIIKKIAFNIIWSDQSIIDMLWTFSLHLNGREVWYSSVDSSWNLIFDTPFEIRQNSSTQTVELRKKSPFVFDGRFLVSFSSEKFEFESQKTQLSLKAEFTNTPPHTFTVEPKQEIHCVESNSQSWTSYCDVTAWNTTPINNNSPTIPIPTNNNIIEFSLRQKKNDAAMLLSNFTRWEIYVTKINAILPEVSLAKLNEVQWKLNNVNMNSLSKKPMLEALVNFLKVWVSYEISLR